MRLFVSIALALSLLSGAVAQERGLNANTIASSLNTPETQWVFNHICVPGRLPEGQGFTRSDFAEAYLLVSQVRWQAALEALARNDEKASMNSLALIIHGVIDAYWPGRVLRDNDGAITEFRDCAALGNLQGVLREERSGCRPIRSPRARRSQARGGDRYPQLT